LDLWDFDAQLSGLVLRFDLSGNFTFNGTGASIVNLGTTAQRPTGVNGMMRYNSDSSYYEFTAL